MAKIKSKSVCEICNQIFLNCNLPQHKRRCDGTGKLQFNRTGIVGRPKGKPSWNKGLTKDIDDRVSKNSRNISNTIQNKIKDGSYTPVKMGKEARLQASIRQSLNNTGGKCKWYDVDGVKVQGTWERDLSIKLNELSILWNKPNSKKDVWIYELEGKRRSYSPDLYLKEYDIFLEIKGYWWGNDKKKMEVVQTQHQDKKVIIIEKDLFYSLLETQSKQDFLEKLI